MVRKYLTLFVTLSMIATVLVGCGKTEQTDISNETDLTESTMTGNAEVVENETNSVVPTETPTPTEKPTPEPTEEPTSEPTETPTSEPTETPTPTPEPTPTPHEHSYTETIITEALCNTTGVKQYSCSCGYSYTEEYIDTHNHQADGNPRVLKESDCIHRGIYGEICLRCGLYVNSKTLELTDHIAVSYWVYFPEQNLYCLGCANCNYTIQETSVKPEGVEIKEATPYYFD